MAPRDSQSNSENRTDWAEDRTDWAEDRTLLANERTFAGWMRTGLGSIGIGIALHAVFGKFEPTWMAKSAATIFLAIGGGIFLMAVLMSRQLLKRLNAHSSEPASETYLVAIATFFIIADIAAGFVLWML